jgi:triosephosphate isomerase (TIM)
MQKIIIANWKLQKSNNQSDSWCENHKRELIDLINQAKVEFVLCPAISFLSSARAIFKDTQIKIGAQNCAPEISGSYTGDTSVLSLHELQITHALIGHSERRKLYCETDILIAQKALLLLQYKIIPVVCIGESQKADFADTKAILSEQISIVLEKLSYDSRIYIAYEPVWAIGTGISADMYHIERVTQYIKELCHKYTRSKILYGGSVNDQNINELNKITHLDGFLLGKSSLDFQMLKKIVLSVKQK